MDNIITISLGASLFAPVVVCCFVIVLLHRGFGWLIVHHQAFGRFIEGDKIPLFEAGKLIKPNLEQGLICEEDMVQGVRKSALAIVWNNNCFLNNIIK